MKSNGAGFRGWLSGALIALSALAMVGCDGKGSRGPAEGTTLSGVVQKGPFLVDGSVRLQPLDSVGQPEGEAVSAKTDARGRFRIKLAPGRWALLTAEGRYFDEFRAADSGESTMLRALVHTGQSGEVNLNLFTTMATARALVLVDDGADFETALAAANADIARLFSLSDEADPRRLDLLKAQDADNASLLLASYTLLAVSESEAESSAPEVPLKALIPRLSLDALTFDFADDGLLNNGGGAIYDEMIMVANVSALQTAAANLGDRYATVELPQDAVPDWAGITRVSVYDATVLEGERFAVMVALNGPASQEVRVRYATRNGDPRGQASAVAGVHYTATSGELVFAPGVVRQTVGINTPKRSDNDTTVRFTLELSDPVNAEIARQPAELTIIDRLDASNPPTVDDFSILRFELQGIDRNTNPVSDPVLFDAERDLLVARFRLDTEVTCTPRYLGDPKPSCGERPDYIAEIFATGSDGQRLLIGRTLVPGSSIRGRNSFLLGAPSYLFSMPLNVPGFANFATARANGSLRFEVVARIADAGASQHTASTASPRLLALDDRMHFGEVETYDSQYDSIVLDPVCAASAGVNGIGLRLTGRTRWQPASDNSWTEAEASFVGVCAALVNSGSGFELWVVNGNASVADAVSTQVGGLPLTADLIFLSPEGAQAFDLILGLPEGLSYHSVGDDQAPIRRGFEEIRLSFGSAIGDFASLRPTVDGGFLIAEGLPFAVSIQQATLREEGLVSASSRVRYLHQADFAARDSRRRGVTANTAHFARALNLAPFTLDASGLTLDTVVPGGPALMDYPRVAITTGTYNISVRQSRIAAGRVSQAVGTVRFGLSADCGGCASESQPLSYVLRSVGGAGIGMDGSVVMRVEDLVDPVWGPRDAGADTHIFTRTGDSNRNGMLYLPGFVALATADSQRGGVAQYLMGAREVMDSGLALTPEAFFPLADSETQRGNHFTAGLTVGPARYTDAFGQPEVGVGSDLSGTATRIGFGGLPAPSYANVSSNIGTRYVVRPGGLTGVFNSDAQPQVSAYGYALDLRRFAFRQVNNRIDEFTWIDGQVAVPEPGAPASTQFRVSLSSLGLECSGDLASGVVDREICGDGIDNNNNGLVDENCSAQLSVWQTDSQIFAAAFRPEQDGVSACMAQNRELELAHSLQVAALSQPLEGLLRWRAEGTLNPDRQRISSPAVQRLDRGGGTEGFPVAMETIAMASRNATTYGWYQFESQVGVPFWAAIEAEGRVANRTFSAADPSVLLPALPANHSSQDNVQLGNRAASEAALALTAKYEWGNTGFGFQLPVYYRPGGVSDTRAPEFYGKRREADLVVLNAGAGIDFIDPARTKISFGASADFDRLRALELDLHIDLNDPESLARVDALLARFGVRNSPVSTTVSTLRDRMNLLNAVAESGLESLIERRLRDFLEAVLAQADGPTDRLAEVLAEIHALPARISDELIQATREAEARMLAPLADNLDGRMLEIYQTVPQTIANAVANPQAPDLPAVQAARDRLAQGRTVLDAVDGAVLDYANRLAQLPQQLNALDARVNQAQAIIGEVRGQLNGIQAVVQSCALPAVPGGFGIQSVSAASIDINASPLYGPLNEVVSRLDNAALALEAIQLVSGFAEPVGQALQLNMQAVRDSQRQVQELATDLRRRVVDARNLIENEVCGNAQAYFNGAVQPAFAVLDRVDAEIASVQTMLNQAKAQAGAAAGAIANAMAGLRGNLQVVRAELDALDRQLAAIQNFEPQPPFTANDLRNALNNAAVDAFGVPFVDAEGRSFVRLLEGSVQMLLAGMREQIPETVNRAFAPLIAVVPNHSGEEIRRLIADRIMESPPVQKLMADASRAVSAAVEQANTLTQTVFDQVNAYIREAAAAAEAQINAALDAALAPVKAIPLNSARLDGYAVIAGNELERAHVGAGWKMPGDADDSEVGFNAALDIVSWSANDKAAGCSIADGSSRLDARISTRDFPLMIGPGDMMIRHLYLQFTLEGALNVGSGQQGARGFTPIGVAGGIETTGGIDFQAFRIYDIGFAAGVGREETYIGARAAGLFEDIALEIAFLVGRTCNADILRALDPDVLVELPNGLFNGVYARGAASFPLFTLGCPLTVGASAEIGGWVLAGPPLTVGGLIGGGAFGRVACIGAIRGQVRATAQKSGDQFFFRGEGFGAAGVGWCEPATWTTRARSRQDDWCATGDAGFSLEYRNGWRVLDSDVSAVH
jgi:hypothetical protein